MKQYYNNCCISDANNAIPRINEIITKYYYNNKATIELHSGELIDLEYGELTGYFVKVDSAGIVPLAVSVAVPNNANLDLHRDRKEEIAYKPFNIELCGKKNVYDYEWE